MRTRVFVCLFLLAAVCACIFAPSLDLKAFAPILAVAAGHPASGVSFVRYLHGGRPASVFDPIFKVQHFATCMCVV